MGACCINTPKCQEEKSVMVLLFLSEENEKAVKEQFTEEFEISFDKLMIFSDFYQNQHRLFITNGRLLSSVEDCYLYLESCSLEGNLRQVVIIVDLESFKKNFPILVIQLTDQTSLFLLNNSEQKLSKKDLDLLNQFGYEQHIIKSIKIKDQFYQTLGTPTCASKQLIYDIPPINNCEDCVKMSLQYINERKQKINMVASMKEIDYCCDMLISFRNQVIQNVMLIMLKCQIIEMLYILSLISNCYSFYKSLQNVFLKRLKHFVANSTQIYYAVTIAERFPLSPQRQKANFSTNLKIVARIIVAVPDKIHKNI